MHHIRPFLDDDPPALNVPVALTPIVRGANVRRLPDSDLVVTITTTITKSKSNIKTILKLNQNTENYIKTATKTMLKLKRFSKFELFTI